MQQKNVYIYSALLSTLLVSILHRRLANLRYPANEVYLKLLSGWFRTEQISLICFPMVSGCLFDRGQFISKEELRRCTVGSLHGSSIQPEHPLFRRNRPLFRRKPPQLVWNCELSTYFLRFWWCYHDLSRIRNITLGRKYRLGLKIQVPIFWVSWSAVTCWSKFVARYPSHQWVKSLEVIILPQSIPTCKLQATYLNFNKKNWCIWNFLSGPKPTKRAPGIAPGIVAEPVGVGGSRSLMSEKQSCRTHTGNSKFPWKAKSCRQQWDTMSPRFL